MSRVLVVDDSMLIRHTVCRFLEERGFDVETAENGIAAMRCLSARRPDLIVTDMQMPAMGGSELIARVKQHQHTAGIPIIVLTGRKSDPSIELVPGAECVIYKDIDIVQQLERAVAGITPSNAAD
jgi:CheY-like chemotaxis protein